MSVFCTDALAGRTAVVTGAGGGLGGAIVAQLAAMGAQVALVDLRPVEINVEGRHLAVECNIANEESVREAAQKVARDLGKCDILINNAAILPAAIGLEEMTQESWNSVIQVNLTGSFLCAKYFGEHMLQSGSGSIVNLASIAAVSPNAVAAYGPSKAGIIALTRQIAVEWGPRGIRANTVSPGLVRTPMSEAFYSNPENLAAREAVVASRRIGSPADVASVVAFLASDAAGYLNGQEITVDGGFLHTSLMNLQRRS